LLVLLPSIEDSCLQLVGLENDRDVLVLLSCTEWFQGIVIPLVKS
jgi:hypothetical protein